MTELLDRNLTRRSLLRRGAALGAAGVFPSVLAACGGSDSGGEPDSGGGEGDIKIGVVDDRSGDFALANVPRIHAYELAVAEINGKGGVNGRKLKLVFYDGQSDVNRYQELTQRLILKDKVDVVMAGYTSSEREAARAVAVKNKKIFWHNNQGEGGIASKYSFFTGPVPEQQILPGVEYMTEKYGKRVYIIAADYGFGQVSTQWGRVAAGLYGAEVIGSEFIPLGNSQFAATIGRVQSKKPDWMLHFLVGDAQTQFYPQAASSGLHLPTLSTVQLQQSYEHKRFAPPALDGMLVPTDYQEELDLPENKAFVKQFRAKFPKEPYINENARSAYVAVNLMALAWAEAGTTDTDKTIAALESGISFDAPGGPVTLDGAVHHCEMPIYLAEVKGRDLKFPVDFGTLKPDWLSSHMKVDLRKSNPERQYTPGDDPEYKQYLES